MNRAGSDDEPPVLPLLEKSWRLLAQCPPQVHAVYLLGTGPFLLALIYAWNDLVRHPLAGERILGLTLLLAVLFFWMRTCQSYCSASLLRVAEGSGPPRFCRAGLFRTGLLQMLWQGWGLLALLVSLLLVIPTGWVIAFLQSSAALQGDPEKEPASRETVWKACLIWPRQNHFLLAILSLWVLLLFVNFFVLGMVLPGLLKSLVGLDSPFARSPFGLFNSTFFLSLAGLVYLGTDPILRAASVLRIFEGQSRSTGQDLLVRLGRANRSPSRATATALSILLLLALLPQTLPAENDAGIAPPPQAEVEEVREALDRVAARPEFAWRIPQPRADMADEETRWFHRWFTGLLEWTTNMVRSLWEQMQRFVDWVLERVFPDPTSVDTDRERAPFNWTLWVGIFGVAVVAALLWAIWAGARRRRQARGGAMAEAESSPGTTPDLTDETQGAEVLPEEEWIRLAMEAARNQQWRPASRALFLAMLAHLGQRGMLHLAAHKSNRDYERELRRRLDRDDPILPFLTGNRRRFEEVWYGKTPADSRRYDIMFAELERVRETA